MFQYATFVYDNELIFEKRRYNDCQNCGCYMIST